MNKRFPEIGEYYYDTNNLWFNNIIIYKCVDKDNLRIYFSRKPFLDMAHPGDWHSKSSFINNFAILPQILVKFLGLK